MLKSISKLTPLRTLSLSLSLSLSPTPDASSHKSMAPLLFKEMKGVNFSCASPASAAICTSIDRRSMVRPSISRAIDRHTPHLRDSRTPNPLNQKSRKSSAKPIDLISPAGSSRYLLNDTAFFDVFPDLEPVPALLPIEPSRFQALKGDESAVLRPSASARPRDQVVVLRVSLHCKGCEGKVRKHISKMEGVTSFNIDFARKKVTVIGDVTPLGVLNSVSKVKNADFWPSPPRASASF